MDTAYLKEETGVFIDFYDNFDKILLSEKSSWFGDKTREDIYKKAVERAIRKSITLMMTFGYENIITCLLLGGKINIHSFFNF